MIIGFEEPNEGDIKLGNESLIKNKEFVYENIGIGDQEYIIYDGFKINDYLDIFFENKQGYDKDKALILLNNFQLESTIEIYKLDFNDLKKFRIFLSLLGNNKIIILDEPTLGMKKDSKSLIWDIIKKYKKDKIIIFTNNSIEEAELYSDKIGIMKDGKIICSGQISYINDIITNSNSINLYLMFNSMFEEAKIKTIKELKNDFKANYKFKKLYNNLLQINISETNFDDLFNYLDTQAR